VTAGCEPICRFYLRSPDIPDRQAFGLLFKAADKVAFADGGLFSQKFNPHPLPDIRFDKILQLVDNLVRMSPPLIKDHKRQLSVLADIELAYSGS